MNSYLAQKFLNAYYKLLIEAVHVTSLQLKLKELAHKRLNLFYELWIILKKNLNASSGLQPTF